MFEKRIPFIKLILALLMIIFGNAVLASASKLILKVQSGKEYFHQVSLVFLKLNLTPQMAFWLEDENGKFITNIYITEKSSKAKWGLPGVNRPAALPVWSHNQGILYPNKSYMPDQGHPLPDAVTGATPTASFTREWEIPSGLPAGRYKLTAEINHSFDYNEIYKKDLPKDNKFYNAENGQPSLIYQCTLEIDKENGNSRLILIGHGDPLGANGEIYSEMTGITSASNIIDSITASYVP